jgi:hypothetical protein
MEIDTCKLCMKHVFCMLTVTNMAAVRTLTSDKFDIVRVLTAENIV